jgi:hypothetical protein
MTVRLVSYEVGFRKISQFNTLFVKTSPPPRTPEVVRLPHLGRCM